MSKLHIEVLSPRTPYQTYLDERLQSARGLGWAMAERAETAARPQGAHQAPANLPVTAVAEPA
jgi:hypothetical protein